MEERLKTLLERIAHAGLMRSILPVEGPTGPTGRIAGREAVVLCGNDYLGLASDPRLAEAAKKAMDREGFGAGSARLVSGAKRSHHELEEALARFKGAEAHLVYIGHFVCLDEDAVIAVERKLLVLEMVVVSLGKCTGFTGGEIDTPDFA